MSSKSKNKGKSWERDFANHLTEMYGEQFVRVPHSGAYIGGSNSVRKEKLDEGQIRGFKGDIIPPSSWKHFNAECKNYGDFPFHQLVQGETKQLEAWISQLLDVADPGDFNILIIKITRKGKFVAVEERHNWAIDTPHFLYKSPKQGYWQIFDYDTFWQNNQAKVKQLSLIKE